MSKCFVYMIRSGGGASRPIKIGMTDNVSKRIKQLQTGNPELLHIVLTMECASRGQARRLEKTLHDSLAGVNVIGEWYKVKGENLYKVLTSLAKNPNCNVVEEFNLKPPVEKTREMLRTARRKLERQGEMIKDMEKLLSERNEKIADLNKKLNAKKSA